MIDQTNSAATKSALTNRTSPFENSAPLSFQRKDKECHMNPIATVRDCFDTQSTFQGPVLPADVSKPPLSGNTKNSRIEASRIIRAKEEKHQKSIELKRATA